MKAAMHPSNGLKGLVAASALGFAGCSGMHDLFEKEVNAELARTSWDPAPVISEDSIARLPDPVQRYFRYSGFIGRRAPQYCRVVWSELNLKRAKDKPWMPLETQQFNSVQEPVRIVYMGAKLMKVLPFEGRDKYQDGHGNMLIKVMGRFKVADEKNWRMDESALVTVLAEALLLPSYSLQPYIRWEPLDSTRAKATLEFNQTTVHGIFHFAPSGECIRFDTDDRWQQAKDSATIPWSAYMGDYLEKEGIRFASSVRAVWHEKTGDFEYVKGRIARIEFDVR